MGTMSWISKIMTSTASTPKKETDTTSNKSSNSTTTTITLKYLELGPVAGQGGVVRFFLLAHDIPFDEQLFDYAGGSWATEKQRLLETQENPCGSVPVTLVTTTTTTANDNEKDNKTMICHHLSQHVSTCRYLAHMHEIEGTMVVAHNKNASYQEYLQDLIAEEYQDLRAQWAHHSFYSQDADKKAEYQATTVPHQLAKFNALYHKFQTNKDDPYLTSATVPLWGDVALFTILYDHIQFQYMTVTELQAYDRLWALYQAFSAIPAVAAWIRQTQEAAAARTA